MAIRTFQVGINNAGPTAVKAHVPAYRVIVRDMSLGPSGAITVWGADAAGNMDASSFQILPGEIIEVLSPWLNTFGGVRPLFVGQVLFFAQSVAASATLGLLHED